MKHKTDHKKIERTEVIKIISEHNKIITEITNKKYTGNLNRK